MHHFHYHLLKEITNYITAQCGLHTDTENCTPYVWHHLKQNSLMCIVLSLQRASCVSFLILLSHDLIV
jgi:hypothetical protein